MNRKNARAWRVLNAALYLGLMSGVAMASPSASLAYQGTLRYPSLQRIPGTPDRLSRLLEAR